MGNNEHVTFRQLTMADQPEYQALIHSAYGSIDTNQVSFDAANETTEENIAWLETIPTYGLFNAEGDMVSAVSLRFPWGPEPGPQVFPHIGRLATHSDHKGHGYAKMVYQHVEQVLKDQVKTPQVTLGTADQLPWLVDMYKRWGFVEYERKQLPGKLHTTVYLAKKLLD
ncbi:GNAT family N-acetyltransferase [Aerococcus agrisoli]|uniref:GNAT family N-acetyltransferase n=1 Tax=Aerococcus agrisoli TaxID=2487350 RepID=A0A3N4GP67_9LACT|nr:GNAT family N-acetyltransferase [Aerococcus agrisoli]RPA62446.1 GNAT family N-acetyltransferase [Aerococcus agrisoli]